MKIRFILNPISGKTPADPEHLARVIQLNFPGADMRLTKAPAHATELAREAANEGFESVVAIGGDGTINETAHGLVGTETALGVIPHGSGNGLAREIGMPLLLEEAVMRLQKATRVRCDTGTANGELFLNMAGVGMEADIAWKFMEYGKTRRRGKWPYFKIGAKAALSYRPLAIELTADGLTSTLKPLTLVFANGRQYGSNFKIAPHASLTDGKLDMITVHDAPKWKLALAAPAFFTDNYRPFGITSEASVTHAVIRREGEILYHVDGEPRKADNSLEIALRPQSLTILFPEK
jgi:YegS/Rv2252/BmrU family lipid kinase